ncbi:MAG TPA: fimbria/pilus periplasmic chaperone [Candidatus Angelobacter sp.]|jgi:fimbrial chaperone protein|nr:fimbria/pilus periplasmic chaperone [Candidatus Angelobacter sp.]
MMKLKILQNRIYSCAIVALWLTASAIPSWCGTFTVTPVRIQVSASRPNAILQVANRDDEPVTLQAHVVAWSFDGQKDVLVDNDEVMLNPPIAVIGAHQTQAIRMGLRRLNDSAQERSYRLILEEVPRPPKPGFVGIRTIVKISIPIFASPKNAIAPKLSWQAVKMSDSRVKLIATNQGSAHIQIKSMDVTGADSPDAYLKGAPPTYLLPNQQREWVIDDERARVANRIKVAAVTDAGALHETIDITR